MIATTLAAHLLTGVDVHSQHLEVALDPSRHAAAVRSTLELVGRGDLRLRLTEHAQIAEATRTASGV